jgi:cell division protein ZapA
MAEVNLTIGGRSYAIACRDGGEDHLRLLASRVNAKVDEARSAVGTANEVRQLLFAALLLADDLDQMPAATAPAAVVSRPESSPELARALNQLAARVEGLADALEGTPSTS